MELKIKSSFVRRQDKWRGCQDWHVWFAWYPVRIDDETVVWLQNLRRHVRVNEDVGVVKQYEIIR